MVSTPTIRAATIYAHGSNAPVALVAVSSSAGEFFIEVLRKQHGREDFECGREELDRYLQTQARQEMERDVAVVYVIVPSAQSTRIAGYYSLSSTAVRLEELPENVRKKLPRYPLVPATLIGRLAIDQHYRGMRLGERLLIDALRRSVSASRSVASVAVVVDAKDLAGAAFYLRYGFTQLADQPLRLFLHMKTIETLTRALPRASG